jgi:integrin-linked kinase-associated serine/threonine phosphatase 2C
MNLLSWFSGNSASKNKKKNAKKKLKEKNELVKNKENPLESCKMYMQQKVGYGPKKTEC